MSAHIVKSYGQELARLVALIAGMGAMAEAELSDACRAVLERDQAAAARAIGADPAVDAAEQEVERFVIRLLALRQPLAEDLRLIVASLKITAAFERIGDYAANVAKRSRVLASFAPPPGVLAALSDMAARVQENLGLVVQAWGERSVEKALLVWRSDEAIDAVYTALFRQLLAAMAADPAFVTPGVHLLFAAKNLERIGDHATNIAETIHYATTGVALDGERPKGDVSTEAVAPLPGA